MKTAFVELKYAICDQLVAFISLASHFWRWFLNLGRKLLIKCAFSCCHIVLSYSVIFHASVNLIKMFKKLRWSQIKIKIRNNKKLVTWTLSLPQLPYGRLHINDPSQPQQPYGGFQSALYKRTDFPYLEDHSATIRGGNKLLNSLTSKETRSLRLNSIFVYVLELFLEIFHFF